MDTPAGPKLHKLLADLGLGSRREMERWIAAGRVQVNGRAAVVGERVAETDHVSVDGARVGAARMGKTAARTRVLVLNKLAGVVCSRRDDAGRVTVFDDLPALKAGRWISVGRLDVQTTGLLVMTTDGNLAHRMMHPGTGLDREYAVRVNARLDDSALESLTRGIRVDGEDMAFSDVRFYDGSGSNHWYHVVLMEGRNREVRRLFEAAGAEVSRLKRVRYGPVVLPSWLKRGQRAELPPDDVRALYKLLKMRPPRHLHRPGRDAGRADRSLLIPYPELAHLKQI